MERRARVWRIGAELVPVFLVLACVGGTLALVIDAHHRLAHEKKPKPAAVVVVATPEPKTVPAEPPAPPPPPEDLTPKALARLSEVRDGEAKGAGEADREAEALEKASEAAKAEAERWARRQSLVRKQVETLEVKFKAVEAEVDDLASQRDVLAVERELAKSELAKAKSMTGTSVLPYKGPNGTWRRPIAIECSGEGVKLQPNGPRISLLDLSDSGYTPRANPIVSGVANVLIRMNSRVSPDGAPVVPYLLFLVRPDGIKPYYVARARLERLGIAFGYELVDQDAEIDFPDLDDPKEWRDANGTAPLASRWPTERPGGRGNGPGGDRPGVGTLGGATGDRAGVGGGTSPWPADQPGSLAGTPGLWPMESEPSEGAGSGTGTSRPYYEDSAYLRGQPDPRQPGAFVGSPPAGSGGGGEALSPPERTLPGGTGGLPTLAPTPPSGGGASDSPTGFPRAPGRDQAGTPGRGTSGTSPDRFPNALRRDGRPVPPPRGGGLDPRRGGENASYGNRGRSDPTANPSDDPTGGIATRMADVSTIPSAPPGHYFNTGTGVAPTALGGRRGHNASSENSPPTSNAAQGASGGMPGASAPAAGGVPGGSSASNSGANPGRSGASGSQGASSSSSAAASSGGETGGSAGGQGPAYVPATIRIEANKKTLEIMVSCGPRGVTIEPGGRHVPVAAIEADDSPLVPALRDIERARKQLRPNEDVRPIVRFRVEPGGHGAYSSARRRLILSGLDWPTSFQVAEPNPLPLWPREAR